jgi:endoglucanase
MGQRGIALGDRIGKAPRLGCSGDKLDQLHAVHAGGQGRMGDASAELLMATHGVPVYRARLEQLLPSIQQNFERIGAAAVLAIPYMGADYKAQLVPAVRDLKTRIDAERSKNPFGVPISKGLWAGSHQVAVFGSNMYLLHRAFPEIIGTEYTLDAIDYLLGRHPANSLSLVSAVGTQSKLIGYGHNRADYSFVAGGWFRVC